jgi:hypothetical protein
VIDWLPDPEEEGAAELVTEEEGDFEADTLCVAVAAPLSDTDTVEDRVPEIELETVAVRLRDLVLVMESEALPDSVEAAEAEAAVDGDAERVGERVDVREDVIDREAVWEDVPVLLPVIDSLLLRVWLTVAVGEEAAVLERVWVELRE